jgi:hypothetical protein
MSDPLLPPDPTYCVRCKAVIASDAEFCPKCGQAQDRRTAVFIASEPSVPTPVADQHPVPATTPATSHKWVYWVAGAVAIMVIGALTKPDASKTHVTAQRWNTVAEIVTSGGASVEPFDPSMPDRMHVILPSDEAMRITDREAKELARTIHGKLGANSIVRIKTPTGQELAKSDWWNSQ